jgi:hypothetical protein
MRGGHEWSSLAGGGIQQLNRDYAHDTPPGPLHEPGRLGAAQRAVG